VDFDQAERLNGVVPGFLAVSGGVFHGGGEGGVARGRE
jgi:hypothetical protein